MVPLATPIPAQVWELLPELQNRGLTIPDKDKAAFYLDRIGWFRFVGYFIPFEHALRRDSTHAVSFDDVLGLYRFDRSLRLLCLDATERIEMAIKGCLYDYLVREYGDWWFEDANVFANERDQSGKKPKRSKLQAEIKKCIRREPKRIYHPQAASEFNPRSIFYLMTFGLTSRLFAILPEQTKLYIASKYKKYDTDRALRHDTLESWLKAITLVRNYAAHHGILWNRQFDPHMNIPGFVKAQFGHTWPPKSWKQKLYARTVIIFYA